VNPEPLRILHLVMLRFWSAIAWHALSMAQALEGRGHTCWIAGAKGSPILREAERAHLAVEEELPLDWLRPWNWLATVSRLRGFLLRRRVDVVFVHTGSGHFEAHVARLGLPAALVRVRADARPPRGDISHRWLYRQATDQIAVSSRRMMEVDLAGWGIERDRLHHLPPGIDCEAIAADPELRRECCRSRLGERYELPSDARWIGIIGRLSPVKGHIDLIRASAILSRRNIDWRLLVVGAEKEVSVAHLRSRAAALGVEERLVFTGHVEDPLVHAAALDVGVIPSLGSETVSRSALEFMAVAVPVVASRVGILPEVIEAPEQLVPPGNPEALADALTPLLNDAARAREAGWIGRARATKNYSTPALGTRAEQVACWALRRRHGEGREG